MSKPNVKFANAAAEASKAMVILLRVTCEEAADMYDLGRNDPGLESLALSASLSLFTCVIESVARLGPREGEQLSKEATKLMESYIHFDQKANVDMDGNITAR